MQSGCSSSSVLSWKGSANQCNRSEQSKVRKLELTGSCCRRSTIDDYKLECDDTYTECKARKTNVHPTSKNWSHPSSSIAASFLTLFMLYLRIVLALPLLTYMHICARPCLARTSITTSIVANKRCLRGA